MQAITARPPDTLPSGKVPHSQAHRTESSTAGGERREWKFACLALPLSISVTAALQPTLAASAHRNRHLFSDHYLDRVLPQTGAWRIGVEPAGAAMREIEAIYRAFAPSSNEAQTEEELVRPVLRALGHAFEVQPALRTADGVKRPDYVVCGCID